MYMYVCTHLNYSCLATPTSWEVSRAALSHSLMLISFGEPKVVGPPLVRLPNTYIYINLSLCNITVCVCVRYQ